MLIRSLLCEKCPFKAKTKAALNCHALKKHGGRFQCLKCNFFGTNQRNLVIHRREKHPTVQKEVECTLCKHTSKGVSNHHNHMASKHENNVFQCTECDYKAKVIGVLKNHIKRVHQGKRYNCILCTYSSTTNAYLKLHVSGVHEGKHFLCDLCDYKSITVDSLKTHKNIAHEGITYPCYITECFYKATQARQLTRHQRVWHSNVPKETYSCDQCDFKSTDKDAFVNKHKKIHSLKIIKCEYCEYTTNQIKHMRSHKQKHHENVVFLCTMCDHLAKDKKTQQTHMESKHGKLSHKCEYCNYHSTSRVYLRNHIHAAHKLFRMIQCNICTYKAKDNRIMKQHKETHKERSERKLLSCPEEGCFKTYIAPDGLKEHNLAIHKGKKHKCDTCEKVCTTKVNLQTHVKSIHLGVRHECLICNRQLSKKSQLLEHIKQKHESEKILNCPSCEFRTVQKYPIAELRRHKSIAHGIGHVFQCNKCDYKGLTKGLLGKHLRLHIPCNLCDFMTSAGQFRKGELRTHKSEKHRNGFKCEHCEFVGLTESKIKKHTSIHSFLKCQQCDFNCYDKRQLRSHAVTEHNENRRRKLENKLQLALRSRFDCCDVMCKRDGNHYPGLTAEYRHTTAQEVAKEMLRVVLEVVAVLVKADMWVEHEI